MERRAVHGRVLIVDDSDIVLDVGRLMLERAGFEVRGAIDLAELQDKLAGWSPDLVLTDVNMPELSGADLCRKIRSLLASADVPIVLLSGLADAQLAVVAAKVGADGWFCKNDGLEGLAACVRGLVHRPVREVRS
jgi:DNA-binding response OmpR family regulator